MNAQDVYRIGTLMELVRVLALNFADDGKRIKVNLSRLLQFWFLLILLSCNYKLSSKKKICWVLRIIFTGMCARVYGRGSPCRDAITACWKQKDIGVHGLGWLWCYGNLYQNRFYRYWTRYNLARLFDWLHLIIEILKQSMKHNFQGFFGWITVQFIFPKNHRSS